MRDACRTGDYLAWLFPQEFGGQQEANFKIAAKDLRAIVEAVGLSDGYLGEVEGHLSHKGFTFVQYEDSFVVINTERLRNYRRVPSALVQGEYPESKRGPKPRAENVLRRYHQSTRFGGKESGRFKIFYQELATIMNVDEPSPKSLRNLAFALNALDSVPLFLIPRLGYAVVIECSAIDRYRKVPSKDVQSFWEQFEEENPEE